MVADKFRLRRKIGSRQLTNLVYMTTVVSQFANKSSCVQERAACGEFSAMCSDHEYIHFYYSVCTVASVV
jgi:hypothetical protein